MFPLVDELPTILTYMEYADPSQRGSLEYGSHFNISFQTLGSTNTPNFTKGVNSVHGSTLKVQFDVQSEFSNGLVNRGAEKCQVKRIIISSNNFFTTPKSMKNATLSLHKFWNYPRAVLSKSEYLNHRLINIAQNVMGIEKRYSGI